MFIIVELLYCTVYLQIVIVYQILYLSRHLSHGFTEFTAKLIGEVPPVAVLVDFSKFSRTIMIINAKGDIVLQLTFFSWQGRIPQ